MATAAKQTIVEALVKAQSQMTGASKDTKGHHGKYATLASVWDTIRKPLTDNGLAVTQHTAWRDEAGVMILTTQLHHISGEVMESEYPVLADYANPQRIGSALTYARRYSLMALVGVAPEDDDGQAAADAPAKQNGRQAQPSNMISDRQRKALHAMGKDLYGDTWDDKRHEIVKAITAGRTESSTDLTAAQAKTLIDGMGKKLAEREESTPIAGDDWLPPEERHPESDHYAAEEA